MEIVFNEEAGYESRRECLEGGPGRLLPLPEGKKVGPAEASAAFGAVGAGVLNICSGASLLHL